MKQGEYVYKSTLRDIYGLPDSWIARLGEPDKRVSNPHHRTGPQAALYLRSRVEDLIEENRADYDALQAKRAARSARATVAVQARIDRLLDWAGWVELRLDELPEYDELVRDATRNHVAFHLERDGYADDDWQPTPGALRAYVRHNLTNYESVIASLEAQPGCHEAYQIVRARVDRLIDEALRVRDEQGLSEAERAAMQTLF